MTILQRIDKNGIALIINQDTGEVLATQGMIAKLCKQESSSIRSFLKSVGESPDVASVIDSRGVKQESKLYSEDAIYQAFAKYYPELLIQCAKAGIRVYLHRLAGYQVRSAAVSSPDLPQTYLEALKQLVKKEEENIALREKATVLTLKVQEDAPKVALADAIAFSEGSIGFGEFAKLIGTGRTRLIYKMRQCGVIMKNSNIPYQIWIDRGYFEISEEIGVGGKIYPFAVVTGKGQIWLKNRLDEFADIENRTIVGITNGVLAMS